MSDEEDETVEQIAARVIRLWLDTSIGGTPEALARELKDSGLLAQDPYVSGYFDGWAAANKAADRASPRARVFEFPVARPEGEQH